MLEYVPIVILMSEQPEIGSIVSEQVEFFRSGITRPLEFRTSQLKKIRALLSDFESKILEAARQDSGKPAYEAYISEIGGTLLELKHAIKNVPKWVRPRKIRTPISQFKAAGRIHPEPKGVVLIIGPWNYPVNLILNPLVGAICAGNCAILKPSEVAPASSSVLSESLLRLP